MLPLVKKEDWIGMDGEGQGRLDHKYILLAASNEDRTFQKFIVNNNGITTEEFLEFILSLPSGKVYTYGFNYDLTKGLTGLDDKKLYELFRPSLRKHPSKKKGPRAVLWTSPINKKRYFLNYQGTKFTVSYMDAGKFRRVKIVWDIIKFFQCKFVDALKEWKIGDPAVVKHMKYMKDNRHQFDKLEFEDVKSYCFDECAYMAQLAHKLYDAHITAGLELKNFYGAGSSGGAILKKLNIESKIIPTPEPMVKAVSQAYFGGRFENSIIGEVDGPIYNYDISSAYPYQTYQLPCLIHAKWELTKSRSKLDNARHALVRYRLPNTGIKDRVKSWAPFPFREDDGSICYPTVSGGGWIWLKEYLWGEKLWTSVEFIEAWIYHSDCDCHPFKEIAQYYVERLKIGKEGPGIVIKLGVNSVYGKLAQSVGKAQYNSWIWAGMITSGCRAQLLELLSLHKKRENVLMMATDGIYSRENIVCPLPIETNTGIKPFNKPLGGWEKDLIKGEGWHVIRGVFMARPGVYYPLDPTPDDIKKVKGRGVGKGVILENWADIITAWNKNKLDTRVFVQNVSRFCGAKTSISISGPRNKRRYKRAGGYGGLMLPGMDTEPASSKPRYGQWITRKVEMSFNPMPKRNGMNEDNKTLKLRALNPKTESMPYKKASKSKDAKILKLEKMRMDEQPDPDLSDYEEFENGDF